MKNIITFLIVLMSCSLLPAQIIEFTFANTQMSNDGMDDFYETDIMIAAIDGLADFKLGAGLLYINYSTDAFGSNIVASGAVEITHPNPEYILGDMNVLAYYTGFLPADNTASRLAFSYQQGLSSGGMTANNVTSTPKKLFHLKIKFVDSGMDPMVVFEDNETQPPGVNDCRDQFFTACGPGGFAIANCGTDPGTQFQNAIFDSSGATLSIENLNALTGLSVHPNPAKDMLYITGDLGQLRAVNVYSFTGQHVMEVKSDFEAIDLRKLQSAIYFMKLDTEKATATIKIIKE